jgi:hypothetical protein
MPQVGYGALKSNGARRAISRCSELLMKDKNLIGALFQFPPLATAIARRAWRARYFLCTEIGRPSPNSFPSLRNLLADRNVPYWSAALSY